jgi:spore germination protein YaaH
MEKFFYRVNKGETVQSVAKKFNVSPISIIKDNGLKEEIEQGDVLCICRGKQKIYFAGPTDTVSTIAEKFSVSEEKIRIDNPVPYVFYGLGVIISEIT